MPERMPQPDTRFRLAAGALLLASVALYIPGLLAPLWIDDGLRTFSTFVAPDRWWDWVLKDVHNPLYNVLMRGWIHLVGDSAIAIRLPTVACAFLAALTLGLWTARRFGRWTGLLAAAVFLLTPAVILHATMAKNGLFTVLFGVLFASLADRLRDGPSAHRVLACAVAGFLGICTDWAFLYVLLPVVLLMGIEAAIARDRRVLTRLGVVLGVVLFAAVPLAILKLQNTEHLYRPYPRHFSLTELWVLLGNWMFWGNAIWPRVDDRVLLASIGMVLVLPLLVAGARPLVSARSGRLVLALLWLPILGTLVISAILVARADPTQGLVFQERNLLVVVPWFCVALACGAASLRPRALRVAVVILVLGAITTASILQWTIYRWQPTTYWPRPAYEHMVQAMLDDLASDPAPPGHIAGKPGEPIRAAVVCLPSLMPLRHALAHTPGTEGIDIIRAERWKLYPYDFPGFAQKRGLTRLYFLQLESHADWIGFEDHRERMERRWVVRLVAQVGETSLWRFDRRAEPAP